MRSEDFFFLLIPERMEGRKKGDRGKGKQEREKGGAINVTETYRWVTSHTLPDWVA